MKKNVLILVSVMLFLLIPLLCVATTTVLTSMSSDHTVTSGNDERIYGTSTSNTITLESGARAELINFPGFNSVQVQSRVALFTVSRSGTLVTFQGSDGTVLKVPATTDPQIIEFVDKEPLTLGIYNRQVMLDDQVVNATAAAIFGESGLPGPCGAYVAPGVWKQFDCYNLAAIGKTTNDDPFTPSWRLIGGYWKWGRKGPDSSQWYDTNTPNFAHGPTDSSAAFANEGEISGWGTLTLDGTLSWTAGYAPDGAWSDSEKTANDPCPKGYRVPTESQWQGVIDNNPQSSVGTWSTLYDDTPANYNSAIFLGDGLMLPAAGGRCAAGGWSHADGGWLFARGYGGGSWSSTQNSNGRASNLAFISSHVGIGWAERNEGGSVRCVAE